MSTLTSGIYVGRVIHERMRPRKHRLCYKVFSLLLNLDDLESLTGNFNFLAYNRKALFSVWDKDHGNGEGIRNWVMNELAERGLSHAGAKITMLCYPRIFGYVFNPLTVFFCHDTEERLQAIIYEVHNTFKERHAYVLPIGPADKNIVRQSCDKDFYVSPFIPMACRYDFRIQPPGEFVRVVIREEDQEGLLLAAAFTGGFQPLNDRQLLRTAVKYPLMTLKVMVGIHFEALRLFLKGAPYFPHKNTGQTVKYSPKLPAPVTQK